MDGRTNFKKSTATTYSKLTIDTLQQQGVKYVQC